MTITIFTQPYLLYLYSVDKYKATGNSYVTLKAKDGLTLVFAARIRKSTNKTTLMEYDVHI